MRNLVWIGVLGLTACTNDVTGDPPVDPPDDVPRTCVATVTGGGTNERVEAELSSADHPTVMVMSRDGKKVLHWTYAYDDTGRLILENHDHTGPSSGSGPDGVVDLEVTVEHSPTSAIQRFGAGESVTSTLDSQERVVRYESDPMSFATFQLTAAGLIEQHHVEGILADVGTPFMYTTQYTYDADGRLRTRGDLGSATPTEYEHAVTAEQMIIRRNVSGVTRSIFTYTYDASGRTIRAEVDDDANGVTNWRVDIAYGADGSVTTTGSRDGNPGRVNAMSEGCGYEVTVPQLPVAWNRPTAQWQFFTPAIPNAYE